MFRTLGFDDARSTSSCASAAARSGRATGAAPTTMTTGYGHGIAVTPLHLASAYAALVNGGIWRPATLLQVAPGHAVPGRRVFQEATSARMRQLLRLIVLRRHRPQRRRRRASASAARPAPPKRRGAGGYNQSCQRVRPSPRLSRWTRRAMWCIVMLDAPRAPPRPSACHRRLERRAGRRARHLADRPAARRHPRRRAATSTSPTCMPLWSATPGATMKLAARRRDEARRADRRRRDGAGHRLRDRPPQGRAGHGVRRLPGRAVQRRGFHSGGGRRGRGRGGRAARGERSRARSISPTPSRAAPSPGSPRDSSRRSPRRSSRSPAPTARPRPSS